MPDERFESLRLELLRSGVAPLYVERTVLELGEHYADLESAALAAGYGAEEAARAARAALGNEREIAAAVLARARAPDVQHALAARRALPALRRHDGTCPACRCSTASSIGPISRGGAWRSASPPP